MEHDVSVRDNQTSEESCVTRMMKMRDVRSQEMEKQMAARPGAGGGATSRGRRGRLTLIISLIVLALSSSSSHCHDINP